MTTIFLSGSRKIGRINDVIRGRIDNMIKQEFRIVIGDANGADKAMQEYLAEKHYPNVVVFCSGVTCRNNLSRWEVRNVPVDGRLKGRDFYTVKDVAMASEAEYGFLLWDGQSSGTFRNLMELIKRGKKALVYLAATRSCHQVANMDHVRQLLTTYGKTPEELCRDIRIDIGASVESRDAKQLTLNF